MMATLTVWTEASAREWLSDSWSADAMSVKLLVMPKWATHRTIDWYPPTPLPDEYSGLRARPTACLEAALRAVESFPQLRVCLGFSFRQEEPTRGIRHLFNLDADGHVVDAALTIYGPPAGYLGTLLKPSEIQRLALENGLVVPLTLRPRPTR